MESFHSNTLKNLRKPELLGHRARNTVVQENLGKQARVRSYIALRARVWELLLYFKYNLK